MRSPLCAAVLAAAAILSLTGCLTGEEVERLVDKVQHNPETVPFEGPEALPFRGEPAGPAPALHQRGTVGAPLFGQGWELRDWGLWGSVGGNDIFGAKINGTYKSGESDPEIVDPFYRSVTGARSFTAPASGGAVWTGAARGYETMAETFGTPVEGSARLEMDFDASSIDVALTSFDRGHADMSWSDVPVTQGSFRSSEGGAMDGAFYGGAHQGVAGKFDRDDLRGVFGAMRE